MYSLRMIFIYIVVFLTANGWTQNFDDAKLKEMAMTGMIQQQLGMLNLDPEQIVELQKRMALSDSLSKHISPEDGVHLEEKYEREIEENQLNLNEDLIKLSSEDFQGQRFTTLLFSDDMAALFAATSNQVSGDYPLKAGDKLVLNVWGVEFKEHNLSLDNSGNVVLPGVGRISLNGMTVARAERLIRAKLENSNYGFQLGVSQISLRVVELSQVKVFVLGNVQKPSAYVLQGNSSILNALYMAGGPSEYGSVRDIQIIKRNKKTPIDLYDYLIKGKLSKHHILRDGDVIFLPKADKLVEINGAIKQPAIYELKRNENLDALLTFAKGKLSSASPYVTVSTTDSIGSQLIVDLSNQSKLESYQLKDGDYVTVKNNIEPAKNTIQLTGNVVYPGKFAWETNIKLSSLIEKAGGLKPNAYIEAIEVFTIQPDLSYKLVLNQFSPDFELNPLDSIHIPSLSDFKITEQILVAGALAKNETINYFPGISLKNIITSSGGVTPNWLKGQVYIERRIEGQTKLEMLEYQLKVDKDWKDFEKVQLQPGDRVVFKVNPNYYNQELVLIKGRGVSNPGSYALSHKGETLGEFFNRVVVTNESVQWNAIRFNRMRGDKKHLIAIDFKNIVKGGEGSDIRLRDGDEIYIPDQEFTVQVLGEVISPGDVLYRPKSDYEDYLSWAGGITRFGDEDKVLITFPNGSRVKADDYYGAIPPGSIIVVSYKPVDPPINWAAIFTGTLSVAGSIAAILLTIVTINEKL